LTLPFDSSSFQDTLMTIGSPQLAPHMLLQVIVTFHM